MFIFTSSTLKLIVLVVLVKCDFQVWEHLLLQLGAAGSVFLPTIPRENLGIPKSASAEGEPAYLPCRPLP